MVRVVLFVLGILDTNTYVVYDEVSRDAFIVDPGDDSPEILDFVRSRGLRVRAIVATHGHVDHVLGVEYLRNSLGVEFYMNKLDVGEIRRSVELLNLGQRAIPKPDKIVDGDTALRFGSIEVRFIHTPGHTPGSTCIYVEKGSTLFSGDTLFRGSVGRTDLPGGSEVELRKSIKKIFTLLPLDTAVHPGHGPSTTLDYEYKNNIYVIDFLSY